MTLESPVRQQRGRVNPREAHESPPPLVPQVSRLATPKNRTPPLPLGGEACRQQRHPNRWFNLISFNKRQTHCC